MPLTPGTDAPPIALPGPDGTVTLDTLSHEGRVVLAFYKGSCPTCQLAFPFLGQLEAAYGDAVPVIAVTQDEVGDARTWLDGRGFAGVVVDDRTGGYAASAAYDLDSVPTLFLVEDGRITHASEGWDREEIGAWNARLAGMTGRDTVALDLADTPLFKPG